MCSALLPLVMGEVVCRIAGYGPGEDFLRWTDDADLQYVPVANQQTWFGREDPQTGETLLPIRINNHGQRGPDYPEAKPAHEKRLVCLGDSLTFGPGVRDEETYPARLQNLLTDDQVRVINAGVNGWATWHYRRFAETKLLDLDPDLLVLGLYPANDMVLVERQKTAFNLPLAQLDEHSALYRFAKEWYRETMWKRMRAAKKGITLEEVEEELQAYIGVAESTLSIEARRKLWMRAIDQDLKPIAQLCAANDIELLVTIIPDYSATEKSDSPGFDALCKVLGAAGLEVFDTLDNLRPWHDEIWLDFDHGHLNPNGHGRLAQLLATEVRQRGLIARDP